MNNIRKYWLDSMLKISMPVLENLSQGKLKEKMPIYSQSNINASEHTYLEALGRTLMGMSAWLETPAEDNEEEKLRQKYANMARNAIRNAVRTNSPDYMNFSVGTQPLVDTAFLAQAILRAKSELYTKLDDETKILLIANMKKSRVIRPAVNNWLLFSAMIEAFLHFACESDWDSMRVDFAMKTFMNYYIGDGAYADGYEFHFDYYNSFVINPMLCDIISEVGTEFTDWNCLKDDIFKRAKRGALVLEQLISPEGTYPVIGRSSTYRFGVFHLLGQMALLGYLDKDIQIAQVRCAMTAVLRRQMEFSDMFDNGGWLQIGVCGKQIKMGETYVSTGSLYFCMAFFLPLGLPEAAPFWSDRDSPWTQKRIWNGEDTIADHCLLE